ncbi:protein-L-isoaspartate(D-aspartate) O-methyltransferase [Marinobacterium jannaschii]|uniref:protein-L-isoaspartate(D-aspartate) O-methyltransferase n=1 Tax=Marinobacterium jannaschii TaxID=64970 RepID=UPI000484E74E|nr:protein-L-isoaspartate(D-aspartate) O-methyltransferase [Marinobacterium jannaschii]
MANQATLMRQIELDVRLTSAETGVAELSTNVKQALARVPREKFVLPEFRLEAWDNCALPIACEQTISQPFIVAIMTELLQLKYEQRVLEVGTGSGYQAAVLAELCGEVHTLERHELLYRRASQRLKSLGYGVHCYLGDGFHGLQEQAPFDAIIVTAAARMIPRPLMQQLAPGGRMVIPVGMAGYRQTLLLLEKDQQGELKQRTVLAVSFVPLVED